MTNLSVTTNRLDTMTTTRDTWFTTPPDCDGEDNESCMHCGAGPAQAEHAGCCSEECRYELAAEMAAEFAGECDREAAE